MRKTAVQVGALVLSLGLAGLAKPAFAVTGSPQLPQTTQHVTLTTTLAPQYGVGPYEGTLELTVSPDGIINGWYRPWGYGPFKAVTGGTDGQNVWLDIAYMGNLHIAGTYVGGKIKGTTFIGREPYDFSATPTKPY